MYGAGAGAGAGGMVTGTTSAFYPYLQFGQSNGGTGAYPAGQGYGVQYPHHLFPYSAVNSTGFPHHYGGPMSLAPAPLSQAGLWTTLLISLVI